MSLVLTALQCRMARAGVQLTRAKLSDLAGMSAATLADFETGKREPYDRTLRDIRSVLESKGVTFLDATDEGYGVRVNEKKK